MKKFLTGGLVLAALLVAAQAAAQVKIGTYENRGKTCDLLTSPQTGSGGTADLYVEINGEYKSDKIFFHLEDRLACLSFSAALDSVANRFEKWAKIAKANGTKDFIKEYPTPFPLVTVAWDGSKWWFNFKHKPVAKFLVMPDGSPVTYFSDEVSASTNEYITKKYFWVFDDPKVMRELARKVKPSAVEEAARKAVQKNDLFN